jgi:SAM-dependent methyltransferase
MLNILYLLIHSEKLLQNNRSEPFRKEKSMFHFLFLVLCGSLLAAPPRTIPKELYKEFTLDGKVLVRPHYLDNTVSSDAPLVYDFLTVENLKQKALLKEPSYYGPTDTFLFHALDQYAFHIKNKKVGIIGSATPWYEAVVLAYGGNPVSVDYNRIISEHPGIRTLTVTEFEENPETFDTLLSISSIEHDGLGRYGDPINPNGDLEAMEKMKRMLVPGGLLFLAVPTGRDFLFWNAHRVYGHARLPLLLRGWKTLQTFGGVDLDAVSTGYHQPVFILTLE